MRRFSVTQKLSDWFKKLSLQRKIVMITLIALLILLSPWLYHRVVDLYGRASCSLSGGRWTTGGILLSQYCVHTFPDAGKPCKSSDECMGGCVLYRGNVGQPPPSGWACRIDNDPFLCTSVIEYPDLIVCPE
jgi:hypothetical protein